VYWHGHAPYFTKVPAARVSGRPAGCGPGFGIKAGCEVVDIRPDTRRTRIELLA
jgi:hypothetical protein